MEKLQPINDEEINEILRDMHIIHDSYIVREEKYSNFKEFLEEKNWDVWYHYGYAMHFITWKCPNFQDGIDLFNNETLRFFGNKWTSPFYTQIPILDPKIFNENFYLTGPMKDYLFKESKTAKEFLKEYLKKHSRNIFTKEDMPCLI